MEVSEFLWHYSRDSEIIKFLFWKFHWVWRDVGGTPRIIKKMTDLLKIVLVSRQCWRCVDAGSWVSLALFTWLRNYKTFYFGSFTEFDEMSEERPELSRKWRICGKLNWLRSYRLWYSLEVLLSLWWCRRNALNYWQNDGFLETGFFVNNLIVGNSLWYFNNI